MYNYYFKFCLFGVQQNTTTHHSLLYSDTSDLLAINYVPVLTVLLENSLQVPVGNEF